MDTINRSPNVVMLQTRRPQAPEDPFYEGCARLAQDYEGTRVIAITARYTQNARGVHYGGIQFEFDTERHYLVPPQPELIGRTVELFASLFLRMSAEALDKGVDQVEGGFFTWDLIQNRLEREHTINLQLKPPKPCTEPSNSTSGLTPD